MRFAGCVLVMLVLAASGLHAQEPAATVRIHVEHEGKPVAGASVVVNGTPLTSDASGNVVAKVAAGTVEIVVVKEGFGQVTSSVLLGAGQERQVEVELSENLEETVTVSATRNYKRVEDQPMRVEVVPGEEVQEKIMMTPGDVSMLLNETNGLRVQTTSPSLGGANVRIQGLRGR